MRVPARKTLAPVPPSEVATWRRIESFTTPEGRYLQAVAFDETRKVVVMFGGTKRLPVAGEATLMQDMWEWSPATGAWTPRPASGSAPEARSGAAMVFDPVRKKMVLFGGRRADMGDDYSWDYEDLWEWDPASGAWTERSGAGSHPSARAQHGMVYEASTGKILLFGGGLSEADLDGTNVYRSLADTWELDPATGTWTELAPASSPSMRHAFGLVWDSARSKAVLFGGMQADIPGAKGVPKQDTWEWDPAAQTWTERTAAGTKPGQRYGHAMAFDDSRNKVVVFGGWDVVTYGTKDLWEWDPTTGTWTQVLTGAEPDLPAGRTYASMVLDAGRSRLELIAGQVQYYSEAIDTYVGFVGSNGVWELDPATSRFTDRTTDYHVPEPRSSHAMAYNPETGKTYVFGGKEPITMTNEFGDLWEWDGEEWTEVVTESSPSLRSDAAMAYDPVRKTLIMFGGGSIFTRATPTDTWEWSPVTRQWTQMKIEGGPAPRRGHAMVTDTTRNKILMFGGSVDTPEGAAELWEWDGAAQTWTDRSPADSSPAPAGRRNPVISFDEDQGKLIVYENSQGNGSFWEWDVVTGGWLFHDLSDKLAGSENIFVVYDSTRRRHIFFPDVEDNDLGQTWELDANSLTWYVRSLASTPGGRYDSAMAYDRGRRVVVLFGGGLDATGGGGVRDANSDTWEYSVTNLANGEGCTADSAASCASGKCVDGVCCASAGCTGACMSCSVPGSEGTCVLAQAGTEVPGSCADGQACDGTGSCKTKNGQACSAASSCASGFCVDGVCCNSQCGGICQGCNVAGRVGTCTGHPSGTDPDAECGVGRGVCKSTCDGVGACTFPLVACDNCLTCDGAGTCSRPDPVCFGGSGGSVPGEGGMSGAGGASGGASGSGGIVGSGGGSGSGGSVGSGGSAGRRSGGATTTGAGGIGGTIVSGSGGSGGTTPRDASDASGGTGGSTSDGGLTKRDGGGDADAGLTTSLKRKGCSCEVGRAHDAAASWLLLIGVALLVRRARRRRS